MAGGKLARPSFFFFFCNNFLHPTKFWCSVYLVMLALHLVGDKRGIEQGEFLKSLVCGVYLPN